jgi:hypothetical protein
MKARLSMRFHKKPYEVILKESRMDMTTANTSTNANNKTWYWVIGGCIAGLVCAIAVCIFGFGGLSWLGSQSADEITTTMDFPNEVQAGDSFEFTIHITNISSSTVELKSVDFSMNYLGGILIDSTEPAYTTTDQYDAIGGEETFQSYYFNKSIAPDETITLKFYVKAISVGDYSGTIDICVNSDFNCQSNIARTIIK